MSEEDINSLMEMIPPKRGEILRKWMLRCVHSGCLKHEEAMKIKKNNPKDWDQKIN